MQLVYDIETDGLDATKVWVLVAHNIQTGTTMAFSDYDSTLPSIQDGINLLMRADVLIGHNIIGFDNRVLDRLYNSSLNEKKCYDTFIMSQVLDYKRSFKHGLGGWGEALHNRKIDYSDWTGYSKEMLKYCKQDVLLNVEVYKALLNEYAAIYKRNPKIKEGLAVEHAAAVFNAKAREAGWNFDKDKAEATLARMEQRMAEIEEVIHPKLGFQTIFIDKEPKLPKYKKNGDYNSHTSRHLSELLGRHVAQEDTHVWPAGKPYQRSREEQITLGQTDLLKEWLATQGWKPDDWTRKKNPITGRWENQSPKLTLTSLEKLGEIGIQIDEYYTIRSRAAVIRGWLDTSNTGRIHGNMWTVGTPSMRCRHEVIVNLPAVDARWGKEIRELLCADPDHVIVGCDSSGNQLRGLCHYVNDDTYTDVVINGDQHQRNADALGISRADAKTFLYAYLFGAGDGKLGGIVGNGIANVERGKKARADFAKSIKGLEEMNKKLQNIWRQTGFNNGGSGWIPAIDGRKIYVPAEHQCLNYLLQATEGISCKASILWITDKLKKVGISAQPRLFYHDEVAYQCKPEDADAVGEILKESFKEGPRMFGIECMEGGDYVIGKDYSEVH